MKELLMKALKALWVFVVGFFKAEADSIQKTLNGKEILKAVIAGLLTGGGFLKIITELQHNLPNIVNDPTLFDNLNNLLTYISKSDWNQAILLFLSMAAFALKRYLDGVPINKYFSEKFNKFS